MRRDVGTSGTPLHFLVSAFRRSGSLTIGASIVAAIAALAVLAPLLSPANPIEMNLSQVLLPPSGIADVQTCDADCCRS